MGQAKQRGNFEERKEQALAFARAAGEEVLFLNTDDAMDVFIEMCGNADLRCDA